MVFPRIEKSYTYTKKYEWCVWCYPCAGLERHTHGLSGGLIVQTAGAAKQLQAVVVLLHKQVRPWTEPGKGVAEFYNLVFTMLYIYI